MRPARYCCRTPIVLFAAVALLLGAHVTSSLADTADATNHLDAALGDLVDDLERENPELAKSVRETRQRVEVGYGTEAQKAQHLEIYLKQLFDDANRRASAVEKMGGDPSKASEAARLLGAMLLVQREIINLRGLSADGTFPLPPEAPRQ